MENGFYLYKYKNVQYLKINLIRNISNLCEGNYLVFFNDIKGFKQMDIKCYSFG